MYEMTNHAQYDRKDRMFLMIDKIGMGSPLCSAPNKREGSVSILHDTGIMVIRSTTTGKIITAYPCTIDEAYAVYIQGTGKTKLPNSLVKLIKRNIKLRKEYHF